ncbi:MAG: amidophosphoribosyltransferase [Fidelibacterota bacterium]
MCGIVGIKSHSPVAGEIYDSLIHLQHRGQDAAGIMTYSHRNHVKKGLGLVRDIFDENNMARLQGNTGLGHTRYPTHGGFGDGEVQPFWTDVPYGIALAHNGNLVNYRHLAREIFQEDKRYLNTHSDTEVLLHIFADSLNSARKSLDDDHFFDQICQAVGRVKERVSGSYSVVASIVGKGLVVFRDPSGIRPLACGQRQNGDGTVDYIFASETTMFYALGYEPAGNVLPGEVIYIDESFQLHRRQLSTREFAPCIFEYVYFARPDTMMNDVSVYRARLRMGQNLAQAWRNTYPDKKPDIVIPAPSTANTAALSLAHTLGVRYSEGLYKNPFIGRTFIMPGQKERKRSVKYKLVPQEIEIRNKRVMIVDDSIVRGNTSREIVKMIRDFGALEVYFVVACPPVAHPCFYGVDMPTRSELIASQMSVAEIESFIGADVLLYQTIDDLVEAVTRKGDHRIDHPCVACLNGEYITGDVDDDKIQEMELLRDSHRNGNTLPLF